MSEVTETTNEAALKEAHRLSKLRDAALRLYSNPDFKTVVLEGYFLHEAAQHVLNASNPQLTQPQRDDILSMALAAGHFKRFLSITVQKGDWAKGQIPAIEQDIEDDRVEALTGERPEREDVEE